MKPLPINELTPALQKRVQRLGLEAKRSNSSSIKPWLSLKEAISDLPMPTLDGSDSWLNHQLQEGAKSYPGHTGSPLHRPSKALKAGDHGVPGGENMILYPDGSIRYLTTRPTPQLGELRNFEFSGTLPPSQPICLARKRIPPNQNGRSAMTRHRFRPGRSVCASYR